MAGEVGDTGIEGKVLGKVGTTSRVGENGRETETEFEEEDTVGEDSELCLA